MRAAVALIPTRRLSPLYRGGLVVAAGAFALAATQHWTAPSGYGPIVLVGLAIVAAQFPLHLAPNDRLDLSAGVYVCLVLLLSTPVAVLLAIPTHLVGAIISYTTLFGTFILLATHTRSTRARLLRVRRAWASGTANRDA